MTHFDTWLPHPKPSHVYVTYGTHQPIWHWKYTNQTWIPRSASLSLSSHQPLSQTISATWSHHHHQPSLKIFNHFKVLDQMEASSSTSSSLRRRAPLRCYCAEKPMLVVSWTADNPDRSFYGCPNYWVFQFEYFVLLEFSFFV